MFRTIWSKSLRDYRAAILGWGIGLGFLMAVGFATETPTVLTGFASLAQLLRFAQLTADNWDTLTQDPSGTAR